MSLLSLVVLILALSWCEGAFLNIKGFDNVVESTFEEGNPCLGNDPGFTCFKGCSHVFLDLGSNIGMHSRFLFEPWMYPNSSYSRKVFTKFIPHDDRNKTCVVGFEPNPVHKPRLTALSKYYKAMGMRADWVFAGVSKATQNITFYHRSSNVDRINSEWGFGKVKRLGSQSKNNQLAETITVIDIALWFSQHIEIKQYDGLAHTSDPVIIMKMDVEAEEYKIIAPLIASGAFCRMQVISIEWHAAMFANLFKKQVGGSEPILKGFIDKLMKTASCNQTVVKGYDDETYTTDTDMGRMSLSKHLGL
jgi:hypothetical protein